MHNISILKWVRGWRDSSRALPLRGGSSLVATGVRPLHGHWPGGVKTHFLAFSLLFFSQTFFALAHADDDRWAQLKNAYFGEAPIVVGDDVISLDAPLRAHDAATVPIGVKVMQDQSQVREVYLFVDKNPLPLAGIFRFTEEAGFWRTLETRIRINEYTNVRAVAVLDNGELHMSERFVKAAGGCSAPAMADMDVAMARAGKMKLLLDEVYADDNLPYSEAVIKISHPNNSGMQFDQISRNYIPAFYVNTIKADLDGVNILTIETNFSMSENPVVSVGFNPGMKATTLNVVAVDSKGNEYGSSTSMSLDTRGDTGMAAGKGS